MGKTTLSRMLAGADYFNCDLPSVRRMLRDTELFLDAQSSGATLIFDGVHRLSDPSQLLKIVADEYPGLRVLATGSSTLTAPRKFRDSLTGRKHSICLHPVLWEECIGWRGAADLYRRLLHGGVPGDWILDLDRASEVSRLIDGSQAFDLPAPRALGRVHRLARCGRPLPQASARWSARGSARKTARLPTSIASGWIASMPATLKICSDSATATISKGCSA